ncbi:VOC family protein [Aetokthonos hydrillicola Thurmond2011]|jgi:catechol 2,3-dioxygenase-like lactoylglutathione lyase family enzyme|uniref:VOC family protein n=1 Tax=Aetokthonos hydrillicola Thurmond2011 TaxID=2712845 RepID=A0AAP5MAA4_9CYAN|nr:VOC family protein [Aetokthonos hydrillicola]MBW4584807.1 VOC family protein [Aetokthonos hydrillicola CCALA 1050]MDR9895354.1 VOC family protein [Aetokthonos hydrillicola Thurmond2011]
MISQDSKKPEKVKVWLDAIDHIQVTSPSEVEDEMLFFYGTILGLTEIPKPEALKTNSSAWYALGDIQIHVSTEKNPNNEASRRHICFRVGNLDEFAEHLKGYGVDILRDRQPIPSYHRFYVRDPGGNRIEILSAK